jgi:hypothetical protein
VWQMQTVVNYEYDSFHKHETREISFNLMSMRKEFLRFVVTLKQHDLLLNLMLIKQIVQNMKYH